MELSVSQLADHTLFIFLHWNWTDRGAELAGKVTYLIRKRRDKEEEETQKGKKAVMIPKTE